MNLKQAARCFGAWDAHNHEFKLGRSSIGCDGLGTLILKLLRRRQCLYIGFYVWQNREVMRALLQRELVDWQPDGLRVVFRGEQERGDDQGFVLYAFVEGIKPHDVEDLAADVERNVQTVCKHIQAVAAKLKGIAEFHGEWGKI